jgi:hypothetical protein
VLHAGLHVLVYALAAAASPLVLTATFLVIRSDRPRTNSIAFLTGFVVGTALACLLGLLLGEAAIAKLDAHDTLQDVLTLLLGLALVAVGLRAHSSPPKQQTDSGRAGAILAGLAHVRPAAAFSMAGLLGFGGPKRLVLTFLAMAVVSEATLREVGSLSLVLVYIGVSTATVSIPVGIVVVAGERAAVLLAQGQTWLTDHAVLLRVWLSLGVGALLVLDALGRLLA